MDKNIDNITSEIYTLIRSSNPCWTVIIYGIIVTLLTIGGILSNCSVVFITFRTKSFRGSVNILLALYSFCECLNLSGNFLSIYSAFSGHYFMPFKSVIRLTIVSFIGAGCALNLLLFTGIERLIVVLFPLKKFNNALFLSFILAFNAFFVGEQVWNFFMVFVTFALIVLTIIVYATIAAAIQCRHVPSNSNSAQFNKRVFLSLCTIVVVNVGGYLIVFCYIFAFQLFAIENGIIDWHANQITGILMHISAASNGPILYWTRQESLTT